MQKLKKEVQSYIQDNDLQVLNSDMQYCIEEDLTHLCAHLEGKGMVSFDVYDIGHSGDNFLEARYYSEKIGKIVVVDEFRTNFNTIDELCAYIMNIQKSVDILEANIITK